MGPYDTAAWEELLEWKRRPAGRGESVCLHRTEQAHPGFRAPARVAALGNTGVSNVVKQVYRERHLREKYGLSVDLAERGEPAEKPVELTEIIDAEIGTEDDKRNDDGPPADYRRAAPCCHPCE